MPMRALLAVVACLAVAPGCRAQQAPRAAAQSPAASPFVEPDASILRDIRYAGPHNFVGRPIAGYDAPRCLLTPQAAAALGAVQADLRPRGLGLLVYDCYRPARAVRDFVAWAKDPADVTMKREFYPAVAKRDLIPNGYIAERSGHSRGSTVDLTLVDLASGAPLDMGAPFDLFDPSAATDSPLVPAAARRNRALLRSAMQRRGFDDLPVEWWHYTLHDEPFPDTCFDLPISS